MTGPPASSKSSLADLLTATDNRVLISKDRIRNNLSIYDIKTLNIYNGKILITDNTLDKLDKIALILTKIALIENKKVIVDANFQFVNNVLNYIELAKEFKVSIGLCEILIDKEDALINGIQRMYERSNNVYFHPKEVPTELKDSNFYPIIPIFKWYKTIEDLKRFNEEVKELRNKKIKLTFIDVWKPTNLFLNIILSSMLLISLVSLVYFIVLFINV